MMPKQLPDITSDKGFQKDAQQYAERVLSLYRLDCIKEALVGAYLRGAQNGFGCGWRLSEMETKKEYEEVIRYYKQRVKEE